MKTRHGKPAKRTRARGWGSVCFLLFAQVARPAATDDPASLDRLQDIVTPPPVPWWPPAPGWSVLAVVLVLVLVFALAWWWQQHRAHAYRRAALGELDILEQTRQWQELPHLLKRVALAAFPRSEVATLTGASWITWLSQHGGGIVFSRSSARLLSADVYSRDAMKRLPEEDWRETAATIRNWIRSHQVSPSSSSGFEAGRMAREGETR